MTTPARATTAASLLALVLSTMLAGCDAPPAPETAQPQRDAAGPHTERGQPTGADRRDPGALDTADPQPEPQPAPVDPLELVRAVAASAHRGALSAALTAPSARLEPRPPRPAGACGRWPAPERVRDSTRAEAAALLPDGALVAAVRSDRAVVQTRLAAPGKVRVLYSAGPDCEEQRSRSATLSAPPPAPPPAPVLPDPDAPPPAPDAPPPPGPFLTAHIPLRDLEPATTYRYRVVVEGQGEGLAGTFTTLPRADDDAPLRLAFGADFFTAGKREFDALPALATAGHDLYLSLGDWPYADAAPPARTLDEFRAKHAESRSHAELQDVMRASGVLAVWDDHEVTNDWDGRERDKEPERLAAALEAWHEFFPTTVAPEAAAAEPPGIFRTVALGRGVELFVLDTRTWRDRNSRADGPDKTMLGAAQREWLLDALSTSRARFKVIVSSVPLVQATTRDDAWDGFRHERELILDTLVERGLDGVVFLSGDQHWLAVHHLGHGYKEFQIGPTAAFLREPRPGAPAWVRTQRAALNFGLLDYAPPEGQTPARLRFRAIGTDGIVLYDEDVPQSHGTLTIETASPLVQWRLDGPHTFAGSGSATLGHVPAGEYRVHWHAPVPLTRDPSAPTRVHIEPGDDAARVESRARPETAPRLYDTFDALGSPPDDPITWHTLDEGRFGTPSRWREVGDALGQFAPVRSSNKLPKTRGDSPGELLRPGTVHLARDRTLGEFTLTLDVLAGDEDAWGLMWDVQLDAEARPTHYHRVDFDAARGGWRLLEVIDGADPTILAEDLTFAPPMDRWVSLRIERRGATHTVSLDGESLASVTSDRVGPGTFGLYSWSMTDLRFDDLVVMP